MPSSSDRIAFSSIHSTRCSIRSRGTFAKAGTPRIQLNHSRRPTARTTHSLEETRDGWWYRLKGQILAKLRGDEAIQFGDIGGRRAFDVLVQQLDNTDPAILTLLGAAWLYPYSTVTPGMRWLRAAGGSISRESTENVDGGSGTDVDEGRREERVALVGGDTMADSTQRGGASNKELMKSGGHR
jgi:hypothetical protein